DQHKRAVLLRGVNLGGHCKLPTSPEEQRSTGTCTDSFYDDDVTLSFVGRPLPLDEAPTHFARLRDWGMTFIRLQVPWESLEHAGPGIYDEEYIDYLVALIEMMPKYGLACFVDPHQDVWSRHTGGSGAPAWTLKVAGMDRRHLHATGAAFLDHEGKHDENKPAMVWFTNATKLACATMFTLFFAGDTFAPKLQGVGDESVQEYLQRHFVACYEHLAQRLAHLPAVAGFESMNEPTCGYVGLEDVHRYSAIGDLRYGDAPSPIQSFALGHGISQTIDVYALSWPQPTRKVGTRTIDPKGKSAWLPGHGCPWKQHGVWDVDASGQPVVLKPSYFAVHPDTGAPVEFGTDFFMPFVLRYQKAIRNVRADWLVFMGTEPTKLSPNAGAAGACPSSLVYAPHWYDFLTTYYKSFTGRLSVDQLGFMTGRNPLACLYYGINGLRRNYTQQIGLLRRDGAQALPGSAMLVGECGISFELNHRTAYSTDNYSAHSAAIDGIIRAMDANLSSFTLWTYNPLNTNDEGDGWNGEDFSIVSLNGTDLDTDLPANHPRNEAYKTLRAVRGVVRPYAAKVAGEPQSMHFEPERQVFTLTF
ncbi:glycoside hydrolase, partial [Ramicandelaber brevisporus]